MGHEPGHHCACRCLLVLQHQQKQYCLQIGDIFFGHCRNSTHFCWSENILKWLMKSGRTLSVNPSGDQKDLINTMAVDSILSPGHQQQCRISTSLSSIWQDCNYMDHFSKQTSIISDNGLSPGRRQANIWNNAGMLLIGSLGTNFNETSIEIHIFSFKKIHLKLSSGKWRPFCLGLNVLTH